jgi:hypothetical protein
MTDSTRKHREQVIRRYSQRYPENDTSFLPQLLDEERAQKPLGGCDCICNLPNGLANHSNEKCPHWVLIY